MEGRKKSPRREESDEILYVVTPGMHGMKQFRKSTKDGPRFEGLFSMDEMTVHLIVEPALDCMNMATRPLGITKYFKLEQTDQQTIQLRSRFHSHMRPTQFATQLEASVYDEEKTTFPKDAKFHSLIENETPIVEEFCGADRFCKYIYEPNDLMSNKRISVPYGFERTVTLHEKKVKNTENPMETPTVWQSFKKRIFGDVEKQAEQTVQVPFSFTGIFVLNDLNGLISGENLLFNEELIAFAHKLNEPSAGASSASIERRIPELRYMPTQAELERLDKAKEVNHFEQAVTDKGPVDYLHTITRKTLFKFFETKGITEIVFVDSTCDVFPGNQYYSLGNIVSVREPREGGTLIPLSRDLAGTRKILNELDRIDGSSGDLQQIIDGFKETMVTKLNDSGANYDGVTTIDGLYEKVKTYETKLQADINALYTEARDDATYTGHVAHEDERKKHFHKSKTGFGKGFAKGEGYIRGGKTKKKVKRNKKTKFRRKNKMKRLLS
jgi:hypothetical protein